ncbi:MAG: SMI1/KNR4 family protein [Cetobacterium sp.]|uniref:SMI1/KNR4 family protein n=1 Tax=Cetobacterium sp. TaxID=2071632 RepID=UPI003F382FA9
MISKEIKSKIILNGGIYKGRMSITEVEKAEKELNFKFPQKYKEFLEEFGYLCIGSNEIYGLGIEGYLNVVVATKDENVKNYIVIQNEGTGYLILLNEIGEVFEYINSTVKKIYNNFDEYLLSEVL